MMKDGSRYGFKDKPPCAAGAEGAFFMCGPVCRKAREGGPAVWGGGSRGAWGGPRPGGLYRGKFGNCKTDRIMVK